jgi:hypothetical protein
VKGLVFSLALVFAASVGAQDVERKKAEKKTEKKSKAKAAPHGKPTPEQIRKFNELHKKQQEQQQR